MIPVTGFKGKRVAVFGLGGSGIATARALQAGGAEVIGFDDNPKGLEKAREAGIAIEDLHEADWCKLAALVLAPGVPLTHPKPHWTVDLARQYGVEIVGDVELFCRERRRVCPSAPLIAITGTNGKSTTTALIAHMLRAAGRDAQMGGNIGTAILSLDPIAPGRHYVIECSSYQIDLAPSLDPSIGIHLNLSPDHLDRHGTFANYAAIKERLVAGSDLAIVGVDDAPSADIADRVERAGTAVERISSRYPVDHGIDADGTRLVLRTNRASRVVADLAGIDSLRGSHNLQNAAAAVCALLALDIGDAAIRKGLESFPGLAHRMQQVGRRGRVVFVNDSKATNADATAYALASFPRVYWIAGGRAKSDGIAPLKSLFSRIAKAYLIGEAAPAFAETLAGQVEAVEAGDLATAVTMAAADAAEDPAPEPAVLLSPACASFDQFANFELRGDAFTAAVRALPGVIDERKCA